MPNGVATAIRTQVATLGASRAPRVLLALGAVAALLLAAADALGWISAVGLSGARRGLLLPALPLAAVLVAETPLREALTRRTLLYALLGPTPRATLAVVRTAVAALLLGALFGLVITTIGVLGGAPAATLAREVAAALLGAVAYTALFGLGHLLVRRGIVAGLVFVVLVDLPLARVPFELRMAAPSAHLAALAGHTTESFIPGLAEGPAPSPVVAALVLLAIAALGLLATGARFARIDLNELC